MGHLGEKQGQKCLGDKQTADVGVDLTDAPLTTKQKEDVRKMLARMSHVFARNGKDLGCTNEVRHEIKLTDKLPFRLPHRRVPPARLEEFRTAVADLLKQGSS